MSHKLKALVVDDQALARADLHFMLSAMPEVGGVTECTSATEALSLLQDDVFDVIFLETQLPGLNGLKAVRIINQLDNPPKVVFVTAYDEYAVKAFELDALDYLVKPFNSKRLAQAIQKVLRALPAMPSESKPKRDKTRAVGGNDQAIGDTAHFKKFLSKKVRACC